MEGRDFEEMSDVMGRRNLSGDIRKGGIEVRKISGSAESSHPFAWWLVGEEEARRIRKIGEL